MSRHSPFPLPPASQNPEMPISFTMSRGFWVLLLYYLGLLPFVPIPEKFLICFLPTIINRYIWGPRLPSGICPQKLSPYPPKPPPASNLIVQGGSPMEQGIQCPQLPGSPQGSPPGSSEDSGFWFWFFCLF